MDFKNKFTRSLQTNDVLFVAVFGTFWGISESTLGSLLHLFKFPFTGLLLGQLGLFILLNASRIHYRPGNIITMGVISSLIMAIAISTVKIGPIVGIISEAIVIELVIIIAGINRSSFIISALTV